MSCSCREARGGTLFKI